MSVFGTWRNEYGSIMTLAPASDVERETGAVRGAYVSSTGSVGRYAVTGFAPGNEATAACGQAIALSVCWHALGDEAPDPSWHWMSGLSGQLSVIGGDEVMMVSHMLVASGDFPGLMQAGSYLDKLCYRRCASSPPADEVLPPATSLSPEQAFSGEWHGSDGTVLMLESRRIAGTRAAQLRGVIMQDRASAIAVPVTGFADPYGADGTSRRALSLASAGPALPDTVSLSGTLDPASGTLSLCRLASRPTAPGDRYAHTTVAWVEYHRPTPAAR